MHKLKVTPTKSDFQSTTLYASWNDTTRNATDTTTAVSWDKQVGGARSCDFLTEFRQMVSKFPTEEITEAKNLTFAPKLPPNEGFHL